MRFTTGLSSIGSIAASAKRIPAGAQIETSGILQPARVEE
jgi:hypothetical protein